MVMPTPDFPKLPDRDSAYELRLTLDQIVLIEVSLERLEAGIHYNLTTIGSDQLKKQAFEEIQKLMLLRDDIQNQLNRQTYKEMWGIYPEEG